VPLAPFDEHRIERRSDEFNTEFAPDVNLAATSMISSIAVIARATRDGLTAKPSEEGARQPSTKQQPSNNHQL